jgi:ubiquinone/menaquinone biosynthesis C-methylase UbiE
MSIERDTRFWDRAARKYADAAIADPAGYAQTLARTRARLCTDTKVLELGCGTGTTAFQLAPDVRSYLSTDISPAMIAIARNRLADGAMPQLSFRVATVEELVRESSRFDAVLGFNYLHLVRDVRGTLRGIHDLLEPGGLFISKTPCLRDITIFIRALVLPAMRVTGMAPYVSTFSASELERQIAATGFDILAVEKHASRAGDGRPYIVAHRR